MENKLKNLLLNFYNKYIKGSISPTESLQSKYDSKVKDMIRNTVQQAYEHGSELVGKQIKIKVPDFNIFISVSDVNSISKITSDMASQFWKTASRLQRRENEFKLNLTNSELEKRNPFDDKAAMIGLSSFVAYTSFNNAVINKTSAVTFAPIDFEIGFDISELADFKGRLQFTTRRDQAVDPSICMPLDGNIYDSDDPELPVPPLHQHCRCVLLPVISDV